MQSLTWVSNVPIGFRDGVAARGDAFYNAAAPPQPAILIRTPYDRTAPVHFSPISPGRAAEAGYAMVIADVRGRGGSDGVLVPFECERTDGYDTVEWVAQQPWCNGSVVMTGWSYVGATCWLAASAAPPALRAIAPINSSDSFGESWSFTSGVREQGFLASWIASSLAPVDRRRPDEVPRVLIEPASAGRLLPAAEHWFTARADDPYWDEISVAPQSEGLQIPVMHIGGWYDIFLRGTLAGFQRRNRPEDRLLIGAWGHDNWLSHLVGPRNLGTEGGVPRADVAGTILAFFDSALRGDTPPDPRVSVYIQGHRSWWSGADWPPPEGPRLGLDLHPCSIEVDPTDLPQALGGHTLLDGVPGGGWGPADQRPLLDRADVAAIDLPPLADPLLLAGPVRAELVTSASGDEIRQWVVLMCQHAPDGALDLLLEGVAEAPAGRSSVTVDLGDIAIVLPAGARLTVLLCGGLTPRWPAVAAASTQQIHQGSCLVLTTLDGPVDDAG